jgi:hypothetical protein
MKKTFNLFIYSLIIFQNNFLFSGPCFSKNKKINNIENPIKENIFKKDPLESPLAKIFITNFMNNFKDLKKNPNNEILQILFFNNNEQLEEFPHLKNPLRKKFNDKYGDNSFQKIESSYKNIYLKSLNIITSPKKNSNNKKRKKEISFNSNKKFARNFTIKQMQKNEII